MESVLRRADTVSMAFVRGMLSATQECIDVDALLHSVNIPIDLLHQADSRVTADQYIGLFQALSTRLNDEGLGFFSRPMRGGSYALAMRSTLHANSLLHSARRLAHAFNLFLDDAQFEVVEEGDWCAFRMTLPAQPTLARNYVHEFMLRVFLHSLVWLSSGVLRAQRLEFACPAPEHAKEYATVFPGDVHFDRPHSAMWFSTSDLSHPVRRDAQNLQEYLRLAPGHVVLPRRTDQHMVARVRQHLQSARPHWPDLIQVAEAMNMSVSSLQRRLLSEGATFQAVRSELRRDLALLRLSTTDIPLAEIAHELGFADNAAFQRAFKSWTGTAPGAYRSTGKLDT